MGPGPREQVGALLPHGYLRLSRPLAANSHSASVGRRLLTHEQYFFAFVYSTQLTGCASLPDLS